MFVKHLHQLLTAKKSQANAIFWFSLTMTFATIYGFLALKLAFGSEYVVQDDARQHVFWMLRFIDPELFPNDLIADYFQSVAPFGYTSLYRVAAYLGIDPLFFNKLLPPILGLITTAYFFGLCLEIFPISSAAFISSLLLNQSLWMEDDLSSGTPRAFLYPLFIAFLYYLVRRSLVACLVAIALLGIFYPQYLFICAGILILRLFTWKNKRFKLLGDRANLRFCILGLGVIFLALLPYAVTSSEFAPVVTVQQAKTLPTFSEGGRAEFFVHNPWQFWLFGERSGLLPGYIFTSIHLCIGAILPFILIYSSSFPLTQKLNSNINLLPQILLTSLFMFVAAHGLLFTLHLPSRYSSHSLRIVLLIAAGITIISIIDGLYQRKFKAAKAVFLGLTLLWSVTIIFYHPLLISNFPKGHYIVGGYPNLYKFFQQQPKDITIASLDSEASKIPTFSGRSILVSKEYSIPYHVGYYSKIRKRAIDLIQAQYSPNLSTVQDFLEKYNITFWLLNKKAFFPDYLQKNKWIQQYQPAAKEAEFNLERGIKPALEKAIESCTVFEARELVVIDTNCLKSSTRT